MRTICQFQNGAVFPNESIFFCFQTTVLFIKPKKNRYKPHKPDSVSKLSFICDKHYCLPVAAYPETSDEQPSSVSIRGITVLKVYPCPILLYSIAGSYPAFSPSPLVLPPTAVIFCGTLSYPCKKIAGSSPVSCSILSRLSSPKNTFRGDSSGL